MDPGDQAEGERLCLWVRFEGDDEELLESIKDDQFTYRVQRRNAKHPLKPRPPGTPC